MKKEAIDKYVFNNPLNFVFIAFFYALAAIFFPAMRIAEYLTDYPKAIEIYLLLFKLMFALPPLAVYIFSTAKCINCRQVGYQKLCLLLIFILCLNNFPFVSIAVKFSSIRGNSEDWILHICNSIATSVFEEIIFRGIIFSLLLHIYKNKKNKILFSILLSSAIFGLTHFVNLTSGAALLDVLLQGAYSALLGGLFALTFLITKRIIYPIIMHTVYNFGGLLYANGLLQGEIWCPEQVLITAMFGIIVGVFSLYYIFKLNNQNNKTT